MTKNDVISELQAVSEWFAEHGRNTNTAVVGICERAIDFIKCQSAEYEQLKHKYDLAVAEREANVKGFTEQIEKANAEIKRLEYTLLGVMHSVDKWLEGDELKQDEVNRAATMREKTLQIVESKTAEIERLKRLLEQEEKATNSLAKKCYKDGVKEFAEKLKAIRRKMYPCYVSIDLFEGVIDNLVKEFTEGEHQ